MATRAQNLDTALDNVAAQLALITANPKPTYTVDGESVSWTEHFTALLEQQENLEKARQRADGPFEVRQYGV